MAQKYLCLVLPLLLLGVPAVRAQQRLPEHFSTEPLEGLGAPTEVPRELVYELQTEDLPPEVILISRAEYDGLFEVDADTLWQTITDLDHYDQFVPRATRSNGLPLNGGAWLQELTLSFRVLFFGEVYDYILRLDQADLDTPGSYGVEYRLERSLDGKLEDVYGGWFLRELFVEGKRYTYVRYWIHTHFAEDSLGLETALKWFGPRDVRGNMLAFVEEARRRSGEEQGAESDA